MAQSSALQTDARDTINSAGTLHNEAIMRSMRVEHLDQAERDLNLYEKVGVLFLLCGDTRTGAQFALERSIVACYSSSIGINTSSSSGSTTLAEWARSACDGGTTEDSASSWATKLCEALCIVRCHAILRRFGFDLDALWTHFLPHLPDYQVAVHPLLKWLYHIGEQLRPEQTRRLIDAVLDDTNNDRRYRLRPLLSVQPERFLELWLLLWLTETLIAVGTYVPGAPARERTEHPDLAVVVRALQAAKGDIQQQQLGERLNAARIRFDFTSENLLRGGGAKKATTTEPRSSPTTAATDRFRVRRSHAGYVLIVNQERFHQRSDADATAAQQRQQQQQPRRRKPLATRRGSARDAAALEQTFAAHGYRCVQRTDLRADAMRAQIDDIVRQSAGFDSLIVCIMSHGIRGHVFGSDSVPVSIEAIKRQMANVPDIPKLLVVQACQPDEDGEVVEEEEQKVVEDGTTADASLPSSKPIVGLERKTPEELGDICVAHSTLAGFESYRNTTKGTWFIQALCEAIVEHGNR